MPRFAAGEAFAKASKPRKKIRMSILNIDFLKAKEFFPSEE